MDLLDTDVFALIGSDGFARLCAAFFRRVTTDPVLRPMYEHDLPGAEQRLRDFLVGRFGGPDTYIQQRGHPRLRMRHARFHIDAAARDRWVTLMTAALHETDLPAEAKRKLLRFFEDSATFLVNRA